MKKAIITLSALLVMTSVSVFAQDGEKKQEPKKEEKKAGGGGGTRMAINEKGLPGTGHKKENSSSQKSGSTSTVSTSKSEEPKK